MRPFFSFWLATLGLAIAMAVTIADPALTAAPPKASAPPKKAAKHAPVGKRAVPKPKYQPKPKVKQTAHKAPGGKILAKSKDKSETSTTTAKTVAPKTNGTTESPKSESPKSEERTEKAIPKAKYDRIASREHDWSRHSPHERLWGKENWHTHRFAEFLWKEGFAFYSFHPVWWHAFVVNPGSVNWTMQNGLSQGPPRLPPSAAAAAGQAAAQQVKENEALPISQSGQELADMLDAMKVESHWLPNQKVDWKTGNPADPPQPGPASNGGSFVAAVCDRRNTPIPTAAPADFEPETQFNWLLNDGKSKSWVKVGEVEAQLLANQGWVVIAAWKNLNKNGMPGDSAQMAVVRPDKEPSSEIGKRGPKIILVGSQNAASTTVKDGFPAGTWRGQEVVYLAHQSR